MATLAPFFAVQFFTDAGAPAAAYRVHTYNAGTTTPKASYTDQAGAVPNANPITLDSAGRCALWLESEGSEYAIELRTPGGALVKRWDDVAGVPTPSATAYVPLAGGVTMTGQFNLSGPATSGLQPVTKTQMDAAVAGIDAVTTAEQTAALAALVPPGVIVMWSGSSASIPAGWLLCNGAGGTPDLRDRFIIGAGSTYSPNTSGGGATSTTDSQGGHAHGNVTGSHALTAAQIPAHTHTIPAGPMVTHGFIAGGGDAFSTSSPAAVTGSAGSGTGHSHDIVSDGGHTHTVPAMLPPYYSLCFIMKT